MKKFDGFVTPGILKKSKGAAFRTDGGLYAHGGIRATLIVHETSKNPAPTIKRVYQWAYFNNSTNNWLVTRRLLTEEQANETFINCQFRKIGIGLCVPIEPELYDDELDF